MPLWGYDKSQIPTSVYGSQTMKSPISRKPVGGSGWEPGFLFEQAAMISDNVCLWDRCPLCQLGPLALHEGGGPPAKSYTATAPAYSFQWKSPWMPLICTPCVDLTADLQHIHTQAAGAFQFTSLYRLFYELPTSFWSCWQPWSASKKTWQGQM